MPEGLRHYYLHAQGLAQNKPVCLNSHMGFLLLTGRVAVLPLSNVYIMPVVDSDCVPWLWYHETFHD